MFHDTAEKCCVFFFDDKNCPTIDVCNGAPPPPPPKDAPSSSGGGGGGKCRWHVDIKMQDGCTDSNEVRERSVFILCSILLNPLYTAHFHVFNANNNKK